MAQHRMARGAELKGQNGETDNRQSAYSDRVGMVLLPGSPGGSTDFWKLLLCFVILESNHAP